MSRTTSIKAYFKKIKSNTIVKHVINYLTYTYIKILFKTYRLETKYNYKFEKPLNQINGVFYFWQQNVIPVLFFFFKNKSTGHCIISPSDDGKIIGFIAQKFGFKIIYFSAYKKSLKAIRQSLEVLEVNKRLAIAGDGSRGPAFKLQRGVIYLASKSKTPLIFLDCKSKLAITFNKIWSKFQLPMPFSKIVVKVNAPVMPSKDAYKPTPKSPATLFELRKTGRDSQINKRL